MGSKVRVRLETGVTLYVTGLDGNEIKTSMYETEALDYTQRYLVENIIDEFNKDRKFKVRLLK